MAPAISIGLKERIVSWYFNDQMTMKDIAGMANVSIGLVSKVIGTFERYGQVTNPFARRTGRPSLVDQGDLNYLKSILSANPSLYLDKIQGKLTMSRNLHVSLSTIERTLQHLDLSCKHVSKAAAERDEELRTLWEAEMAQYTDPEVFVFLDESAVDQHTAQRTRGRSAIGTCCVRRMAFIRGIRHSILPALTLEGIIALDIFEGSVNKDRFLDFLRLQVVRTLLDWTHKTILTIATRLHSSIVTPTNGVLLCWTTVLFTMTRRSVN